jgi:prolyl oligopeptidase
MKDGNGKIPRRRGHEKPGPPLSAERNSRDGKTVLQLRGRRTAVLLLAITGLSVAWIHAGAQTPDAPNDKYLWLEDVHGERSMAWVKAENERSAKVIENDPHFAGLEAAALKVLESPDRLPTPQINGSDVYNTWQDAEHVRGILRRTTVADYFAAQPHWQTVLDYDALAKQDNESWVQKGLNCLYPGNDLCLVSLSAGGEDAVTLREFSLKSGKFVEGGFVLPRSKQYVAWVDKDTLLVARDWGTGTMSRSGYPFVVKLWKRSQPLDQAKEVYRGAATDELLTTAASLNDGEGNHATVLFRGVTFFEPEFSLLTPDGAKRIALPGKADINGLVEGQMIATINEDWTPEGHGTKLVMGSIIALNLGEVTKDPRHLKPSVVFAPTAREFAQSVDTTKSRLLLTTLENVQGRAYVCTLGVKGVWRRKKLDVPDNRTVNLVSTNWSDNQFFLSLEGFLTPSSLWLGDAGAGTLKEAKSMPPQFDASGLMVEQLEAISKDGTKVPYFVVRRKDIKNDGTNPTLLTAYGGFQSSETPDYSASIGKLWLERGGVFVDANIRGGGEFGPAWHEAGLKTHRQHIYDDFAAVGQDLVTRRITSRRRLGIEGFSNGGLLMGVEMTQHPEMWNAIVIGVPLLDMLRFEQIAAGASWVGEYGTVKNPEERAFLTSISPYYQLKPDVDYPEPLIFTTTKDDRVGPVHARKFAAKMEEFKKPFFYEEIVEGGHGAGADLKQQANTAAFKYTYLTRKLMD